MTDITSRHHLGGEDPRWIQLFTIKTTIDLISQPQLLLDYCHRWSINNATTKNFLQFLEQTNSRLKFITKKKITGTTSLNIIQECCTGLYIGTVFLQYLISHFDTSEIKNQLGLPATWPEEEAFQRANKPSSAFPWERPLVEQSSNSSTPKSKTPLVFESFIEEVISVLDNPNTE